MARGREEWQITREGATPPTRTEHPLLPRARRARWGRGLCLAGASLLLLAHFALASVTDSSDANAWPVYEPASASREWVAEGSPPLLQVTVADGDGAVLLDYRPVPDGRAGILWLSGTDGGIDGPFDGCYSGWAAKYQRRGIASVQLLYREPGNFQLSLHDAQIALDFMREQMLEELAVVGFSFGGGVAIETAAQRAEVNTVVVLSGQGYGTDNVAAIAPRPLLLVHANRDTNLPLPVAQDVFDRAEVPALLTVLASEDHYLQDVEKQVEGLVRNWLRDQFSSVVKPARAGPRSAGQ